MQSRPDDTIAYLLGYGRSLNGVYSIVVEPSPSARLATVMNTLTTGVARRQISPLPRLRFPSLKIYCRTRS